MNKLLSYRRLPISSSTLILILFVLTMVVWVQGGFNTSGSHLFFLFSNYVIWGLLLPLVQGIVALYKPEIKEGLPILLRVSLIVVIHFILSNILYYTLQYFFVEDYISPSLEVFKAFIGPSLLARGIDFILFYSLLIWIERSKELNEKELKLITMEANLDKMKLKSLQSQLNPHFLFNTLHNISSLIGRDDNKARDITIKISSLLRKVLETNNLDSHSLQKELEFIDDYLSIEQERFRDRLTIDIQIVEEVLNVIVPTFTLQPIVENAFKHGIGLIEGKTKLIISIRKDELKNLLLIEVINTLPNDQSKKAPSTGIGLANLSERLDAFYNGQFQFSAQKTIENTYIAKIIIPLSI